METEAPNLTPATLDIGTEQTQETEQKTSPVASATDEGSTPADPDAAAVEAGEQDTSIESYADFTLPEGMGLDQAVLEQALPIFKEKGFTQEQAQAAVDLYAQDVQARGQEQEAAFSKLVDEWKTQSVNDKEFGGDRFEQSVKIANSALDKFGTPELKTLLNEHGVGNHPELIRMFLKVGRLTQEDNHNGGGPVGEQKDRASILYG